MASSGNTLLIGMLFLVVVGIGGYFLWKKSKESTVPTIPPITPAVDYTVGTGLTYPTGGYYLDINNYYDYDFDSDRYDRDRDYRDWWDRYGRGREKHWWEFWKDDDDGRRQDDRSYMYYWNRFGDELRSLGLDDTDIDAFVRWVTKRNRNEREIREWINNKVAEHGIDNDWWNNRDRDWNGNHDWNGDWAWNRYGSIS